MKNLIGQIHKNLKKHQVKVKLPGEKRVRTFFLIIMKDVEADIIKDMRAAYTQITPAQLEEAKKVLVKRQKSDYGVLVDSNNTMVFAFNMLFQDYDQEQQRIFTRNLDGILQICAISSSQLEESMVKLPRRSFHDCGCHAVMKYAAPEPRD